MVVVSDLVARVRAEGYAETRQAVAAVGAEAKATAEQLDQLSRKFANSQSGSAAEWRTILERQHLSASAVAAQLGTAATNTTRLASATQQVVVPTQAAAKAAADLHEGFRLSESSVVRFGAGILGVGLGISLVAGTARILHNAITGIVDSQLAWERSTRIVTALYGQLGPQVMATAQAQAALPGGLSSQAENVQSAINARFLSSRYGLPQQAITDLTTSGVRLAGTLGLTDPRDRAQLQAQLVQFAESGGEGLRTITGTEGSPEMVARRLGMTATAGLQALTPQQLVEARRLMASADANRMAATSTDPDSLLSKRTELESQILAIQDQTRRSIGAGFQGSASLVEPLGPELQGFFAGSPGAPSTGVDTERARLVTQLQSQVEELTKSLGSAADAATRDEAALRKFGLTADSSAARLLNFTGSLTDPTSIAHGDIGAAAQAAVAARMRSSLPAFAMPDAEIRAIARQDAYQQARQDYYARTFQQSTNNAIREELQQRAAEETAAHQAERHGADQSLTALTPAQRALQDADRRTAINTRIGQAQTVAGMLDIRTAETQANLEAITLTQRERGLQLMRETVDLRRLDVQQQQALITATQGVIRAQQAALPAQYRLADAQFQGSMASALAQQRVARNLRGADVSDLPTISQLIDMNVQAQFASAEAAPGALAAGRAVDLAQRPATAAALAQQLTASQIQVGQLGVDLKNMGELPEQTALQLQLIQNNRDQLTVARESRDALKELLRLNGANGGISGNQALAALAAALFGDDGGGGAPASSDLAGARR